MCSSDLGDRLRHHRVEEFDRGILIRIWRQQTDPLRAIGPRDGRFDRLDKGKNGQIFVARSAWSLSRACADGRQDECGKEKESQDKYSLQ